MNEKKVLDYKKKIDDFSVIVRNHSISSNIFSFLEESILPDVWFSNFDMSQSNNRIQLAGESKDMKTFSRQIQVFEKSQDYVKDINISVLDSQVNEEGRVRFVLSFSLDPKIFTYKR